MRCAECEYRNICRFIPAVAHKDDCTIYGSISDHYWKARAEALERALIELSGHCDSCVNFESEKDIDWQCDKVVADFSCWQFDQARFNDKTTPYVM